MNFYTAHTKFLLFAILFLGTAAEIFAAEGDLDFSFGANGIVRTDSGSDNESVVDLMIQPDGKIVAIGYSGTTLAPEMRAVIVRYNPDGSIDTTFGTDGKVIVPPLMPRGLVLQPNGKIVIAGTIGTSPNGDFYVARLNADGSFDVGFNQTGAATLDLRGTNDNAAALKIQTDGKILVGGGSRRPNSDSQSDFAIARFNADGTLDSTFDGDGKVLTTLTPQGESGFIIKLAVQSDGKILAAGNAFIANSPGSDPIGTFATVRYNSDGSLDKTFDGDGIVTTQFISTGAFGGIPSNFVASILVQNDSKIVVVGTAGSCCAPFPSSQFAAARYDTNGSLDASFANGGKALISFPANDVAEAYAAAIQSDNKIVIVGSAGNVNQKSAAVVRLNPNGAPDTTFSGDGRNVILASTGSFSHANAVAIQPDGKILLGGSLPRNGGADFLLARFESSFCSSNCPSANRRAIADFDGDGKSDISVYRPSNSYWYISKSSGGYSFIPWGISTDTPVPGDYDGDGKTDIAVYRENATRPSTGGANNTWYILKSSDNTFYSQQWGTSQSFERDAAEPVDYDGDGKTDLAVYTESDARGGNGDFKILQSSTNTGIVRQWGFNTDIRVPADYDGDGKADLAVVRNGVWYISQSLNGAVRTEYFGLSTDRFVPRDYDGDGKADIAVWRPSNGYWYRINSGDKAFVSYQFGLSDDRQVPADYDGDGKTDIAVWRPSTGVWYLQQSTKGFRAEQFGLSSDVLIPNQYPR